MALTADELADIRLVTGATGMEAVISDPVIQAQYLLAVDAAPSSAMYTPYTYVYVLLRLLGHYARQVRRTTDHGDKEQVQDYFNQTERLLRLWGSFTGLTDSEGNPLGTLSTGVLALDLDATEANQSEWDGSA